MNLDSNSVDTTYTEDFYSSSTPNIALFKDYRTSTSPFGGFKLYRCKIIEEGIVIRDYIPVLDWSMTPCLYDKVSESLFYNQGTGNFTYGREIHYVDWLRSDGNQYIDTGIIASNTIISEVKCHSTIPMAVILGSTIDASTGRYQIISSSTNYSARIGNLPASNTAAKYNDLVVAKLNPTNRRFILNGKVANFASTDYGELSTNTITLFRRNPDASSNLIGEIYYCKIWNNTTLIRDYKCAIDENGIGFMIDEVQHKIYNNAGTGNFTYPDVELEYLESDGDQYIDTKIVPTNNTITEIKCKAKIQSICPLGAGSINSVSNDRYQILTSSEYYSARVGGKTIINKNATWDELVIANLNPITSTFTVNGKSAAFLGSGGSTPLNTLTLFKRNMNAGEINSTFFIGSIYYCKMWNNSNIIKDFIPVYHNGDACMYDILSGQYYMNAGIGTFKNKIKEPTITKRLAR